MNLFAYGTLMWPEVLEAVTGRRLAGEKTVLAGYTRLRVKDQLYPVIIPSLDDAVEGVLYRNLTAKEFQALDAFEGEEYDRTAVCIGGTPAFVYVLSEDWKHIADSAPWNPEDFAADELAQFCSGYKGWKAC
ncbi:gamma-glutamylcyclotransferase [Pontiellaceae bacterium B12219]|nr:gamma-glutamylcyclotransferase [Pontiellaceae bacterium B12219]